MKCENIQFNLSVYLDDVLTKDERATADGHLAQCPLCRRKLSDFQMLHRDLRVLPRAPMPSDLLVSVRNSVSEEIRAVSSKPKSIFSEDFIEWLQMRVMPYGIATAVTLAFGLTLLWSLLSAASGVGQNAEIAKIQPFNKPSVMLADSDSSPRADDFELSAADYAAARLAAANDSPSLNPNGALIALTKSLVRGNMKDDEVVVVADVFGNGLAQISEVVEPSSDRYAVRELEKALKNNPDYAPFVPASLDGRSDTVRVVLRIQRVDIQTHARRNEKLKVKSEK